MCSKPFKQGVMEYGCGQCMPCRINRRRVWTARLLLEAQLHEQTCFVTLTYSNNQLPLTGSLNKRDYQLFLKRLRKNTENKISYYIVGEYGECTGRPHYHCVLFGFGTPDDGRLIQDKKLQLNYYHKNSIDLLNAWALGDIHVGEVNEQSLAYACKHITKGLKNNTKRPDGKMPEFARMSLRPAIGKEAIRAFAEWLTSDEGSKYLTENGDVPSQFRVGGRTYMFGRYLRQQLMDGCGLDSNFNKVANFNAAMRILNIMEEKGIYDFKEKRLNDKYKADFIHQRQKTRSTL